MLTPLYKETNFADVKRLYLLMGTACNMHCRHCIQTPVKEKESKFNCKFTDKRVLNIVDHYVHFCVNDNLSKNRNPYIMFLWGGEPLLYWDFIKDLVVQLTEKHNILQNRNFRFKITTNGLLLDKDKINFINKYQIITSFSYDAPWPFAVRDYISDDICELVKQINRLEIQTNHCAYNCDQLLAYRCTRVKFPNAMVRVNSKLVRNFDMPADIYNYDMEKVHTAIRKMRIGLQIGHPYSTRFLLNGLFLPLAIAKGRFLPNLGNERSLCIHLDGRIRDGFNAGSILANVECPLEQIFTRIYEHKQALLGFACKICRNKNICRVPCFDMKDEAGNFVSCLPYHIKYFDYLKEELAKTKYLATKEDIDWYNEQEKIDMKQVQIYLNEGKRYEKEHTRFPLEMMKKYLPKELERKL